MSRRSFTVERRAAYCAALLAAAACGDGVGRPLLASVGGSGGVAGATSAAGSGGVASATLGGSGGVAGATSAAGSLAMPGGGGGGPSTGGNGGGFFGMGARSGGGDGWLGGAAGPFRDPGGGGEFDRMDDSPPFDGQGGAASQVPSSAYCSEVVEWPPESAEAERLFQNALDAIREAGIRCGDRERGAPLSRLSMVPELRCAARLHSLDMASSGIFDHAIPPVGGEGPAARIAKAGHAGATVAESIARSDGTHRESPTSMILNGEDCETLLDPRFNAIGVGYYQGFWTIELAGP